MPINRYWLKQRQHFICFTEQRDGMLIVDRSFELVDFLISKVITKEEARAYYKQQLAEGWSKISGEDVPNYCKYKCGIKKEN